MVVQRILIHKLEIIKEKKQLCKDVIQRLFSDLMCNMDIKG